MFTGLLNETRKINEEEITDGGSAGNFNLDGSYKSQMKPESGPIEQAVAADAVVELSPEGGLISISSMDQAIGALKSLSSNAEVKASVDAIVAFLDTFKAEENAEGESTIIPDHADKPAEADDIIDVDMPAEIDPSTPAASEIDAAAETASETPEAEEAEMAEEEMEVEEETDDKEDETEEMDEAKISKVEKDGKKMFKAKGIKNLFKNKATARKALKKKEIKDKK